MILRKQGDGLAALLDSEKAEGCRGAEQGGKAKGNRRDVRKRVANDTGRVITCEKVLARREKGVVVLGAGIIEPQAAE